MNDRSRSEENRTEEEKAAPDSEEKGLPRGEIQPDREVTAEEGEDPSGREETAEEGKNSLDREGITEQEKSHPEEDPVPPGEVDERISSYVNEHIRNGGRQRIISPVRVLLFAVLIVIIVFFFVDYALMKRQIVSGWFSGSSTAGESESREEAAKDGEDGADQTEDDLTEPTAGVAEDDATDGSGDEAGDSKETGSGAENSAGADGNGDVEGANSDENSGASGDTISSVESENEAAPAETVMQYLVYIEVTNAGEIISAQSEEAGDIASGQQTARQSGQSNQTGQTDLTGLGEDDPETTEQGDPVEEDGQAHVTTGVIVEIGQSAIRILTDYASVEYAETIEITLNGGATVAAQIEAADLNTGLALLAVSVAELSNDTLKEIRMATWGDTSEIGVGTGLLLATAAGWTEESLSGTDEGAESQVSLAEITILDIGEKKQPDTVFTTYSFDMEAEGCRILVDENGDIVAIGTAAADGIDGNAETENGAATSVAYCADDLRLYIEKMVDGLEIPYVGITGVTVTDEIKESVSLDMPYGVYVWLADTGSPAYQAGILNGDIITAINGVEITTVQEMRDAILALEPGEEASFTLMRQGGSKYREYTLKVTPEAWENIFEP